MPIVRHATLLSVTLLLMLALPLVAAAQPATEQVSIYLIAVGDDGASGERVGCGDSLIPVTVEIDAAASLEERIAGALGALFAIDDDYYGESGLYNSLHASNLTVDSVTVTGRSALVELSGSLQLVGTCEDPRMEGQIVATIEGFAEIDGAAVLLNGDWLIPSQRGAMCFPETDHCVANQFLAYWENNGGILLLGYPITDLLVENGRIVQYFERQRLEYHPENAAPYTVLLGRLGFEAAEQRGLLGTDPFQPVPAASGCRYFPVTGHNVCGAFLARWQKEDVDLHAWAISTNPSFQYDSLHLFGYPISEQFVDPTSGLTVQYFERFVFEHHPGNAAPWNVLLERLGAILFEDPGLAGGVLATFAVNGEQFALWSTNPTTIDQLLALERGEGNATIPNGPLQRGPGQANHNAPWTWHLDPDETEMAEATIELCDGAPSDVEEHLDEFIEQVGHYCPWGAELIELRDYR